VDDEDLVGVLGQEDVTAARDLHQGHALAGEGLLEHLGDAAAALVVEVDLALVGDHRPLLGVEEAAGTGEIDLEHPPVLEHEAAGLGGQFRVLQE
jgi:hypothetical protein